MLTVRKASHRGQANHGWLESAHSFSFAHYHDASHMGYGNLRVINEDRVAPSGGFSPHGHRNKEIVSYVLSGTLAHQDSMGNATHIHAGDVQRMSAGSGVTHSEFNASSVEPVHFLQIWFLPLLQDVTPSYEQRFYGSDTKQGRLVCVVSGRGHAGAVKMNADAAIFAGVFHGEDCVQHQLDPLRKAYVHVIAGTIDIQGNVLDSGDGLYIKDENVLTLSQAKTAEILVFDLAA